jgi:hypothetical protein
MGLTAHERTPIVLAAQTLHAVSIVNSKTFAHSGHTTVASPHT